MTRKHYWPLFLITLMALSTAVASSRKAADVPDGSERHTTLDLFVMSHCPYALTAEMQLIPLAKENRENIDLNLYYIVSRDDDADTEDDHSTDPSHSYTETAVSGCSGEGSGSYLGFKSLHGKQEIEENMRQLIIKELYPDAFLDYLLLRADGGAKDWKEAADDLGIDTSAIEAMTRDGTGELLLLQNSRCTEDRRVTASPTLFINGKLFTGRISYSGASPGKILSTRGSVMRNSTGPIRVFPHRTTGRDIRKEERGWRTRRLSTVT